MSTLTRTFAAVKLNLIPRGWDVIEGDDRPIVTPDQLTRDNDSADNDFRDGYEGPGWRDNQPTLEEDLWNTGFGLGRVATGLVRFRDNYPTLAADEPFEVRNRFTRLFYDGVHHGRADREAADRAEALAALDAESDAIEWERSMNYHNAEVENHWHEAEVAECGMSERLSRRGEA